MDNDFRNFLAGKFVPTERQLSVMTNAGFRFPPTVKVAPPRPSAGGGGKERPIGNYDGVENPGLISRNNCPDLIEVKSA